MMDFEALTAYQLIERLEEYSHNELHLHHTWRPSHANYNGSNHRNLQQNMRNYHVHTNGWSDIAQHVTLFPDGTFLTGRDFAKNPASIKGYNEGAFCVEMLGNFDEGYDKLEGAQLEALIKLAKYFDDKGKYIRFHRENSTKTCPGSGIDKEEFMAAVKNYEENLPKCEIDFEGKQIEGVIIDGVSYAPVREIAELNGLRVGWDNGSKTVLLNKKAP